MRNQQPFDSGIRKKRESARTASASIGPGRVFRVLYMRQSYCLCALGVLFNIVRYVKICYRFHSAVTYCSPVIGRGCFLLCVYKQANQVNDTSPSASIFLSTHLTVHPALQAFQSTLILDNYALRSASW